MRAAAAPMVAAAAWPAAATAGSPRAVPPDRLARRCGQARRRVRRRDRVRRSPPASHRRPGPPLHLPPVSTGRRGRGGRATGHLQAIPRRWRNLPRNLPGRSEPRSRRAATCRRPRQRRATPRPTATPHCHAPLPRPTAAPCMSTRPRCASTPPPCRAPAGSGAVPAALCERRRGRHGGPRRPRCGRVLRPSLREGRRTGALLARGLARGGGRRCGGAHGGSAPGDRAPCAGLIACACAPTARFRRRVCANRGNAMW